MNESSQREKLTYVAPATDKTSVKLESPLMAASKDKVVTKDGNTDVNIKEHEKGGDFVLNDWNE